MKDFFVSYTASDGRWAEWIAWELQRAGRTTCLMAWDFRPGMDFVAEMHGALKDCERTLAVLSPGYMKSPFCQPEWTATFAADPTGKDGKLLLVRVADCKPEGLLRSRVYADLVGLDEQTARARLLAAIQAGRAKPGSRPPFPAAPLASIAPLYPGVLPPVWTVPFPPNPHFTGREQVLAALRAALTERAAAITQPYAVHGLGGIGKTQLATEYAWAHRADYEAVLWVVADSPGNADRNLADLCRAGALNLPEAQIREQDVQLDAVRRWLRDHHRWLLILDSVDTREAAEYVRGALDPAWTDHIIVTSRRSDWNQCVSFAELTVPPLPEEAAVAFLRDRVGTGRFDPGTDEDARILAHELGGLPLALEQAAAYMLRRRVMFATYLDRLQKARPILLAEDAPGGTCYLRPVAQTWLASEEQMGLLARVILRLVAYLASDDIPRALFEGDSKAMEDALQSMAVELEVERPVAGHPFGVESALVELADYSLIALATQEFSCHRLVQAVQRDRLNGKTRREWVTFALRLTDEIVPPDTADAITWPLMNALRAHVETIVAHAHEIGVAEPTVRLMGQLGSFLGAKALYREAESLLRRALAIAETAHGPDHPELTTALDYLAQLLQATNRLGEAEPLMRRALAIAEKSYGPDRLETATALNNLAQVFTATNRLGEAEPLMRRALAINTTGCGPDHPRVATALSNLAQVLTATNRLGEAEPLMRCALAIAETSYPQDHPRVATMANNLAQVFKATNRQGEAEPLLRRALAIAETSYPQNHPELATMANNLAQLLRATNRLGEAEPLMRRALAILRGFRKRTGHEHPTMGAAASNYSALLREMGLQEEEVRRRVSEATA